MDNKPRNIIIDWLNTIWETDLPSNCKLVACFLRKHMNSQSDMAWPSLATISGKTRLSKPTVIKALDKLESEGWITKEKGGIFNGKNKSNIYYARFPKLVEDAQREALELIINSNADSSNNAGGSKGALPRVVKELNYGSKGALPKVNNRSKQVEVNNIYTHFDDFWNIYPRKTDKARAKKIWDKLKPNGELFTKINIHISTAYRDTPKQYIPHPTTYLNNERWNDEVIQNERQQSTNQLTEKQRVSRASTDATYAYENF